MASSQGGQVGRQDSDVLSQSRQAGMLSGGVARSVDTVHRLRNEESWVEISSQPSSSSLSSIGDEIVTTGLRVQSDPNIRRRRRIYSGTAARGGVPEQCTNTSSQDEYEESESEEDHVMTSSNENIAPVLRVPRAVQNQDNSGSDSDDDDGNATALGRLTDERAFTPQPNVFSHPPSIQNSQRQPAPGSYFPRHPLPQSQERQNVSRSGSRAQHSPYNTISPAHQVDHDAALRASLTTLLSCAAAARGLPKRNQNMGPVAGTSVRPEFTGLRLVPESELMGTSPQISHPLSPSTRPRSSPSISDQDPVDEKGKRKAVASKPSTQSRAVKKKRIATMEEAMVSPTLLTWVVSAGVVVLVSVVGFGAGYAMGKEVGRQETLSGLSDNTSCGKEALKQVSEIRRFRWGGNGSGIAA